LEQLIESTFNFEEPITSHLDPTIQRVNEKAADKQQIKPLQLVLTKLLAANLQYSPLKGVFKLLLIN
jgi:hypothetical protein